MRLDFGQISFEMGSKGLNFYGFKRFEFLNKWPQLFSCQNVFLNTDSEQECPKRQTKF